MWLTKDERRVLTGYYHLIGTVDEEAAFRLPDLAPILNTYSQCPQIAQYGEASPDKRESAHTDLTTEIRETIRTSNRIRHASNLLVSRGLITMTNHQGVHDVVVVTHTIAGYDLGRKYASRFIRTGLWFAEYKDHWIWLVLGFFGGIIGALAINILETLLFP